MKIQKIGLGKQACRIPRPYMIWSDGVYIKDSRAKFPKHIKPDIQKPCPQEIKSGVVRVSWSPLWIAGYGEDVDTGNQFVRLRTLRNGRLYDEWVERGLVFHDYRVTQFADRGFPIDSIHAKAIVAYLAAIDARNAPARLEKIVNRHGYVPISDGRYGWVIGRKWIGPASEKAYLSASSMRHPLMQAVHMRGDIEPWLKLCRPFFRRVGDEAAMARWMIAMTFAPALLRPLDLRSFAVHHWGQSGKGKSAMSRLQTAAYGDPNILCMTLNRTVKSFGETFRYFTDLPAVFDELQAADFRKDAHAIGLMIHSVVQEQSRMGANRDGSSLRKQVTWKTILKLNGEEPILGNSRIDLGGFAGRVLQTKMDMMSTDEAKALNEALNRGNYGHAGPYFLSQLEKILNNDPGSLASSYASLERSASRLVSPAAQRRAPMLAVVALAEILFRVWFLDEPYVSARTRSVEDMASVGDAIDTGPTPDVAQSAREIFQSFMASNPGSFVERKFADGGMMKERNLAGYVLDRDVGATRRPMVAWIPRHAHELLTKHGLNPDRALSDMQAEGKLIPGKKRMVTQVQVGHGDARRRFWAYVIDIL